MAAFDTFRRKAITVILETKKSPYLNSVSPLVVAGLCDPKMGTTIPILISTSPKGEKIWGDLNYQEMKSKRGLKDLSSELLAIQKGEADPPNSDDIFPRWNIKKKPGYGTNGKFIKLESDAVHVLTTKGTKIKIKLNTLCEPAVSFAKMMAGQKEEEAVKAAAPKEETWTNTKGSIIKATFVSLQEDQITLKLENGKETTFSLDLLSEESRTLAKSYSK